MRTTVMIVVLGCATICIGCGAAPGAVEPRSMVGTNVVSDAGAALPPAPPGAEPEPVGPMLDAASGSPESTAGDSGQETACRVALLHPEWGGTGPLAGLSMAIRTTHAVGTREEVLKLAKMRACAGVGIPADRCTDDLFDPAFERCDGDPPRPRRTSP